MRNAWNECDAIAGIAPGSTIVIASPTSPRIASSTAKDVTVSTPASAVRRA
jgi:hypothetical protein